MNKIEKFLLDSSRIPATAKIFFLQNLFVMTKTGIPLAESLETLEKQIKNKKLKSILGKLCEEVKKGKTLGESLIPYQKDFGELFINMIKAGEASGSLEEILKKLYKQTKSDHELKTKVRNAMTYPAIIVVVMIGIGAFVVFFVMPNITGMFEDLDVELPIATRIMIGGTKFIQTNGAIIGAILLVVLLAIIKLIRTKKGKRIIDLFFLKIPVLSPIIKKINLARAARSLSSLIKTDIAISESMVITSKILGNSLYKEAMMAASEQVKKGKKLEEIFNQYSSIFPPVVTQMIAIGEETGALDEVLENMAGYYEEDVSQTMETLPSIIEPILMVLIGIAVAGVALAVLMPMYTLTQSF